MKVDGKGFTRKSLLEVVGRKYVKIDGILLEDWLMVKYNGNTCKVSNGFFGTVDMDFSLPQQAIITHMVVDERDDKLRFPVFEGFYYGKDYSVHGDDDIYVVDQHTVTGARCKCGEELSFTLNIHDDSMGLCADCFAKVGKVVIDGLR